MDSLCEASPDGLAVFRDDAALDGFRPLCDLFLVHNHHGQGQTQEGTVSALHASGIKARIAHKLCNVKTLISGVTEYPYRLVLRDRREKLSHIHALFPGFSIADGTGFHVRLFRILQIFHQLVLRDI